MHADTLGFTNCNLPRQMLLPSPQRPHNCTARNSVRHLHRHKNPFPNVVCVQRHHAPPGPTQRLQAGARHALAPGCGGRAAHRAPRTPNSPPTTTPTKGTITASWMLMSRRRSHGAPNSSLFTGKNSIESYMPGEQHALPAPHCTVADGLLWPLSCSNTSIRGSSPFGVLCGMSTPIATRAGPPGPTQSSMRCSRLLRDREYVTCAQQEQV